MADEDARNQAQLEREEWEEWKKVYNSISIAEMHKMVVRQCDLWGPYLGNELVERAIFDEELATWSRGNSKNPI